MSSTTPRKPLLNGLHGNYELSQQVRSKMNIPPGILMGPARDWSNVDSIIQDYFKSLKSLFTDSHQLLQDLKVVFEKLGNSNNTKLHDYARALSTYYTNTKIERHFHSAFADEEIEFKIKEAEKRARDQGIITAGALAVEGGIHLQNRSERRVELGRDSSFGSDDYTPATKNRTIILMNDTEDDHKDEDIATEDKWLNEDFDISIYLFEYRKQSMHLNTCKSDRELSPTRLLSLSHIFFFPKDKRSSCIWDLENTIIETEYANMHSDEPGITCIPHAIVNYVNQVIDAYSTNNKKEVAIAFGKILVEAGQAENDNDVLITAAHIIIDLCKKIANQNRNNPKKINKRFGEDTFIHQYLTPWIDNIFHGETYGCNWANAQLELYDAIAPTSTPSSSTPSPSTPSSSSSSSSSSTTTISSSSSLSSATHTTKMYPDFKLYTNIKSTKFDLFVVEIKPPGSSLALYDQRKVAYELKKMIGHIVEAGFPFPVVCGLWVDGTSCTSYKLDLKHSGIYRFIELDHFDIPVVIDDIAKMRHILWAFNKMKTIIDETATMMENYAKMRRSSLNSPLSNTNKRYTRSDQMKSSRIKKQKLID